MALTVLVTGASSGIGTGIVEVLTGAGHRVYAAARRADRLETLKARTGASAIALDITDGAAVAALARDLTPDVLVLNAGRGGGYKGLAATPPDEVAATVGTNVTATLTMLGHFLPAMIDRGRGHVVTMGSVAGLYPSISALYGATKAAVRQTCENLRLELRGTGLRVSDIRPGRVTSEFYDRAVTDPEQAARIQDTQIRELTPLDIGEAVRFAIEAPPNVNVSAIEVQPVEQTYGGFYLDP
ncbi:MAG: SDR family oxidoreductase [Pseudomonadota bacterium]